MRRPRDFQVRALASPNQGRGGGIGKRTEKSSSRTFAYIPISGPSRIGYLSW
jgi:hypothetical protein